MSHQPIFILQHQIIPTLMYDYKKSINQDDIQVMNENE